GRRSDACVVVGQPAGPALQRANPPLVQPEMGHESRVHLSDRSLLTGILEIVLQRGLRHWIQLASGLARETAKAGKLELSVDDRIADPGLSTAWASLRRAGRHDGSELIGLVDSSLGWGCSSRLRVCLEAS